MKKQIARSMDIDRIPVQRLTALLETGRQSGVERFILEVRAGNVGAIRLYEQLGFEPLGVRKGFYEHPREDAVIMAYGERVNECPYHH